MGQYNFMKIIKSSGFILLWILGSFSIANEIMAGGFKNNNPMISLFGLPGYSNSKVTQPGVVELGVDVEWSSIYYLDPASSVAESFVIDAETTHLNFLFLYGAYDKLEIGFIGSLMSISGGILDKWINTWHDAFNLVDYGRDDAPLNELNIRYQLNDTVIYELTERDYGVMDSQLFVGYQFFASDTYPYSKLAMRFSWDIPVGETKNLTGSESNEFALWGDYSRHFSVSSYDVLLSLSAGVLKISKPQFLPQLVKDKVLFTGLGIEANLNQNWSIYTFLSNHGQFYGNTNMTALTGAAGEMDIGFAFQKPAEYRLKFGFKEDFNVGVSPDIVFYAGYQYKI